MTGSLTTKILCGWVSLFFTLVSCTKDSDVGGEISNRLGKVEKGDLIQRISLAGNVVSAHKVLVAAPYNGYVRKIFVTVGQKVKVGDPLFTIVQSLSNSDSAYPLRAPFSGTVVQIQKNEGEFAREGDTKDFIVRIEDLDHLSIQASATEIDRSRVRTGLEVLIRAAAVTERTYSGVIREISLASKDRDEWGNRAQVEFPMRVDILDADPNLRPGMSAILDVVTAKRADVLYLGHEYIHQDLKDPLKNWVLTEGGQKKTVKLGLQNEDAAEIVEGLTLGEKIRIVDFANE